MNLYIHIPFCAQRCSYCDFYTQTKLGLRAHFVEALCREIELRRPELPEGDSLQHIYIGGGTPSLLSPTELRRIMAQLYRLYPIQRGGERTIECNPDDLNPDYAQALAEIGFNRVSMGVQSFQEADLAFLNRRHSVRQVYEAVEALRKAGIDNLSLDLIYGLPNQTEETWADNIRQTLSIAPPHISAYHLIYEEGTPLTRLRDLGKVKEVSEQDSLRFLEMLIEGLTTAGYQHYEISNFALPERHARLNSGYWLGDSYLGFGTAAHGYDGRHRRANIASLKEYIQAISERWEVPHSLERLSDEDLRREFIMMRLRTHWGIPLSLYQSQWGNQELERLLKLAQPYLQRGQLLLSDDTLRLSPSGLFLSDAIILALWG